MNTVSGTWPGVLSRMAQTTIREARQVNRDLGRSPAPGSTHQQTARLINLTSECHDAICAVSRKLAKGIFYNETGRIFPNVGCLILHWFSNTEFVMTGKYRAFEMLMDIPGNAPTMKRSGKLLHNQFEYNFTETPELFLLRARVGFAFGLVIFGSEIPGSLEKNITRLREDAGPSKVFPILQSSVLPTWSGDR